jgi:hypothetical protein
MFYVIFNPLGNLLTAINDFRIDKNKIILGDSNARNTMWNYNNDATGEMLENFIHTSPLLLRNPGATRIFTHISFHLLFNL